MSYCFFLKEECFIVDVIKKIRIFIIFVILLVLLKKNKSKYNFLQHENVKYLYL